MDKTQVKTGYQSTRMRGGVVPPKSPVPSAKKPHDPIAAAREVTMARSALRKAAELSDAPTKRADDLPLISVFSRKDMDLAKSLMLEYRENKEIADTVKDRQDQIKQELHTIGRTYDTNGMRWGTLVVYDRGEVSRPSCKIDHFIQKLVEAGVDLDVISEARIAATKPGKEFLDMAVKDLAVSEKSDKGED